VKKILLVIALAAGLLAPMAVASSDAYVAAAPAADPFSSSNAKSQACAGISGSESSKTGCTTPGKSISAIIVAVLNFLSAVVGIAAVIMVIVGGFKYITAAGDSGKAAGARSTIVYAIVGIVIAALAQGLVQFVLKKVK
jgi:hypothetical protein